MTFVERFRVWVDVFCWSKMNKIRVLSHTLDGFNHEIESGVRMLPERSKTRKTLFCCRFSSFWSTYIIWLRSIICQDWQSPFHYFLHVISFEHLQDGRTKDSHLLMQQHNAKKTHDVLQDFRTLIHSEFAIQINQTSVYPICWIKKKGATNFCLLLIKKNDCNNRIDNGFQLVSCISSSF